MPNLPRVSPQVQSCWDKDLPDRLQQFHITREALSKVSLVSAIVSDTLNRDFEVGGLLANKVDMYDGISRDITVIKGQEISPSRADLVGALEAKGELETGDYKAEGMWHSHGNIAPFHSGLDNAALKAIYIAISGDDRGHSNRFKREVRPTPEVFEVQVNGKDIVLALGRTNRDIYHLSFKTERCAEQMLELFASATMQKQLFKGYTYAKSLVINKACYNKPTLNGLRLGTHYYAELMHTADLELKATVTRKGLELVLHDEDNRIELNENVIREMVLQRVNYQGRPLKAYAKPEVYAFSGRKERQTSTSFPKKEDFDIQNLIGESKCQTYQ
jgi:hypothetical protein